MTPSTDLRTIPDGCLPIDRSPWRRHPIFGTSYPAVVHSMSSQRTTWCSHWVGTAAWETRRSTDQLRTRPNQTQCMSTVDNGLQRHIVHAQRPRRPIWGVKGSRVQISPARQALGSTQRHRPRHTARWQQPATHTHPRMEIDAWPSSLDTVLRSALPASIRLAADWRNPWKLSSWQRLTLLPNHLE
jgi:hypothetical protein